MENLQQEPDYTPQWQDLRRRIALFFLCWLGGLPATCLCLALWEMPEVVFFSVYALAFFVSGARWSLFPCPHCGKPFFKPTPWSVNQLLDSCPHCGLRKGANSV